MLNCNISFKNFHAKTLFMFGWSIISKFLNKPILEKIGICKNNIGYKIKNGRIPRRKLKLVSLYKYILS